MNRVLAGLVGLLFGFGLVIGGMTNANKVIGFLDIGGNWDPTLAFVMGGAVVVNTLGMRIATGRAAPWFAESFSIPTRTDIDMPLVLGSALFGLGWGLGGYCPGPGIVSVTGLSSEAMTFVATMILGMLGYQWWSTSAATATPSEDAEPSAPPTASFQTR